MDTSYKMYGHFSQVAQVYTKAQTTDIAPIIYITETLKGVLEVRAADIG